MKADKFKAIAHTQLIDTASGQRYDITLHLNTVNVLNWLGAKAIRNKSRVARALSGALAVKATPSPGTLQEGQR